MATNTKLKNLKLPELNSKQEKIFLQTLGAFFVAFVLYLLFLSAPFHFPEGHIVEVPEGASLSKIAENLQEERVIRHPFLFKALAYVSGKQKDLIAGDYFFEKDANILVVLGRVSLGNYGLDPTFVTLPEGATVIEMAGILNASFEDFDKEKFIRLAEEKEGFLFPDTYSFLPNVKPESVISIMEKNFVRKTEELLPKVEASGRSLKEIITMASLLEEEARTRESRELIAGILWKRIEIGMPLQVDAVFPYIIGKNTFELSLDDLDFDSPYNTYKYVGLPPGPITNPGLDAIEAALNPKENPYLFYLSDMSGNMHYAEDFEAHKQNKALYLN